MTELREKVRASIANAAQTFDSIQTRIGVNLQNRENGQREWGQTLESTTDAIMALIDRPAPVVVNAVSLADQILRDVDECFDHRLHCDGLEKEWNDALNATLQRILSAVNAVSEAKVRADERERLAAKAESDALCYFRPLHDPRGDAYEAYDGPNGVADWLRSQGRKS